MLYTQHLRNFGPAGVLELTGLWETDSLLSTLNEFEVETFGENNDDENDGIPQDGHIHVPLVCFISSYM